jgi:ABC-type multidrug transport system permease subunit
MKLNDEQITYIENYIQQNDINYYEIYIEILDHMILSVEELLEKNPTKNFEEAVLIAKVEGFGRKKGFRGLLREKLKLAQKKARKDNLKSIKEFFTFPKLVLTLSVFVCYYWFLNFFKEPQQANIVAISIVALFGIFQSLYYKKYTKINKMIILKTQLLGVNSSLIFALTQLSTSFIIYTNNFIDFSHFLAKVMMSIVFTFALISLLVFIEVRKKTIQELKTQIFA